METINSDLEDEDDTNETSLSSVLTAKESLSLIARIHHFTTYNEGDGSLQRATTVEVITIRSKKQTSIMIFFILKCFL